MDYWLFNCKEISRLVSESMDRTLPIFQRIGIRIHLLMCRYCARYEKQLRFLRRAIRVYSSAVDNEHHPSTLSEESCNRMKCKLHDHLKDQS